MDEADYLGDRIAIMGEGKIKTCGSSLYLKKTFGVGYSLSILLEDEHKDFKPITDFITSTIENSAYSPADQTNELIYMLPSKNLKNFPTLFRGLEQKKEQFGI